MRNNIIISTFRAAHRRKLASSSTIVSYALFFPAEVVGVDAATAFAVVTTRLKLFVSSGSFTSSLRNFAADNGVTAVLGSADCTLAGLSVQSSPYITIQRTHMPTSGILNICVE